MIAEGELLNGIYRVRGLIARGGMGEVYEGVNVHTDERVAIKIILPHLAADPDVQALFLREARTLTRLTDAALVQYRVLAQEHRLGVLYIVTEFIDGPSLADVMGRLKPGLDELHGLVRRLAVGLKAAHDLGAVHRDLSPDNILLDQGDLARPKVIDFGIAKDLGAASGTVIGAGFAGKLAYVAPEQLGAYERQIGPWTDVYSLGLVILALATGEPPFAGSTIYDAAERRQKGPDLSRAPEALRPLLQRMLEADPASRLRSMDEVLALLGRLTHGSGVHAAADVPERPRRKLPVLAILGAAAAMIVLAVLALFLLSLRPSSKAIEAQSTALPALAESKTPAPVDIAKYSQTAQRLIGELPCAWFEVKSINGDGGAVNVTLTGVSGDPASAGVFERRLQQEDGGQVRVTEEGVAPLNKAACAALEAVRQFRAAPADYGRWVTPLQAEFRFGAREECGNDPNQALTAIDLAPVTGSEDDLSAIGWESSGELQALFTGQAQFDKFRAALAGTPYGRAFEENPAGRRLNLCANAEGYQGVLVIRGPHQESLGLPGLTAGRGVPPPSDFSERFTAAARANGWRTQMVWYRIAASGA